MTDNALARWVPPQNALASGWDRDSVLPFARPVYDGQQNGVGTRAYGDWQFAVPQVGADIFNAIGAVGSAPWAAPYDPRQRDHMIETAGAVVGPMAGVGMARAAMSPGIAGTELGAGGGRRSYSLKGGPTDGPEWSRPYAAFAGAAAHAHNALEVPKALWTEARLAREYPEMFSFAEGAKQVRDNYLEQKSAIRGTVSEARGTKFYYDIVGDTGEVGNVRGHVDGNKMFIDYIHAHDGGGPNSLGVGALRALREQVRGDFPGVKTFHGDRVSGARAKAGAANMHQTVDLPSWAMPAPFNPWADER